MREPPRWAGALIRATVPLSPYREAMLGDLHEGHERIAESSPSGAAWWYSRRALSITLRYLPRAVRRPRQQPIERTGDSAVTSLGMDLRLAVRLLLRTPAFTLVVLATLAVGIGANTAVFGVVRGVLLEPLPYPDPDRVVALWSTNTGQGEVRNGVSRQDANDWIAQSRSFEAIGTFVRQQGNASQKGEPERVAFAFATPALFRALAVAPALGRPLTPADDGANVAVVSHGYWVRSLGSDPSAVGRTIRLDNRTLTVVGVMPAAFEFPDRTTVLWTPFPAPPDQTGPRVARWVYAVARLRAGVSMATAQAEMDQIAGRLAVAYPKSNRDVGVNLERQLQADTRGVRSLLLVAWGTVGLVLLVVVTNVATLFLARASAREGEMAVRSALGAGRGSLVRQFLVEGMLLAVVGGVLGVVLAAAALPGLRDLAVVAAPRPEAIGVDPWVLGYSLLVSLIAGGVVAVLPAMAATRVGAAVALRRNGRGSVARGNDRLRAVLVSAQVALGVVVLVGATLVVRSVDRLGRVDPGFAPMGRLAFRVAPDQGTYTDRRQANALFEQLFDRVRALPGVQDVGAVNRLPLTGAWWTTEYAAEGALPEPGRAPTGCYRVVSGDYFRAAGIPVLRGSGLERPASDSVRRVVVSRVLAERAWPGRDPSGQRITFDLSSTHTTWFTVVGVVGDVRTSAMADPPQPLAYVLLPQATFGHFGDWGMDVVVRFTGDPAPVIAGARETLGELAPSVPLFQTRPLSDLVTQDLARQRALMILLSVLAGVSAALSGLGLYGLIAYQVSQRRPELGLRMALGADQRRIRREVVSRGIGLAMVGVVVGLGLAAATTRMIGAMLYGVGALDPLSFAAAGVVVLAIAAAASFIPALRASRVQPLEALRSD